MLCRLLNNFRMESGDFLFYFVNYRPVSGFLITWTVSRGWGCFDMSVPTHPSVTLETFKPNSSMVRAAAAIYRFPSRPSYDKGPSDGG